MKLILEKERLELLISNKREYIDKKVTLDVFLSAASTLLSAVTATYSNIAGIPGYVFKILFFGLGIVFFAKSIYDLHDSKINNYSGDDLLKDIYDIKIPSSEHSLIAIQRDDKFLLVFKESWTCKLFINYKTIEGDNERNIIDCLCRDLKLNQKDILCEFISEDTHIKYSPRRKEKVAYEHRLYKVVVNSYLPTESNFKIGNNHYYWMSIPEMESDSVIMEKNSDVVNFVKKCFK